MSDSSELLSSCKIPKLTNTKAYSLLRTYIMELIRKDGVLNALTENAREERETINVINRFNKMDEKSRSKIFVNLCEQPATLVTSLLMLDGTKKVGMEQDRRFPSEGKYTIKTQITYSTSYHHVYHKQ